jgi:hypothetical protein
VRIGIEIKAASDNIESAIKMLKECIKDIKKNKYSEYFPLNDIDNSDVDISIVELNDETVFDYWGNCTVVKEKE